MSWLRPAEAGKRLGISNKTIRRLDADGKLVTKRTEGGHRRVWVEDPRPSTKVSICYCRVSSSKQRDDLGRQVARMQREFPWHVIVQDIGSRLNYRRKGFVALLERVVRGDVEEIVVADRDRLVRFGFDLVEWLCFRAGTRLVVLGSAVAEPESVLVRDLVAIITCFACRIHGRRSHLSKNPDPANSRTKENPPKVVRNSSVFLQ